MAQLFRGCRFLLSPDDFPAVYKSPRRLGLKCHKPFIYKVFQSGKVNAKIHPSQNCETLDFTGLKRSLSSLCGRPTTPLQGVVVGTPSLPARPLPSWPPCIATQETACPDPRKGIIQTERPPIPPAQCAPDERVWSSRVGERDSATAPKGHTGGDITRYLLTRMR